jgi:hypothetical protein
MRPLDRQQMPCSPESDRRETPHTCRLPPKTSVLLKTQSAMSSESDAWQWFVSPDRPLREYPRSRDLDRDFALPREYGRRHHFEEATSGRKRRHWLLDRFETKPEALRIERIQKRIQTGHAGSNDFSENTAQNGNYCGPISGRNR